MVKKALPTTPKPPPFDWNDLGIRTFYTVRGSTNWSLSGEQDQDKMLKQMAKARPSEKTAAKK